MNPLHAFLISLGIGALGSAIAVSLLGVGVWIFAWIMERAMPPATDFLLFWFLGFVLIGAVAFLILITHDEED